MSDWLDVLAVIPASEVAEFEAAMERHLSGLDVTYQPVGYLAAEHTSPPDDGGIHGGREGETIRTARTDRNVIHLELRSAMVLDRLRRAIEDVGPPLSCEIYICGIDVPVVPGCANPA